MLKEKDTGTRPQCIGSTEKEDLRCTDASNLLAAPHADQNSGDVSENTSQAVGTGSGTEKQKAQLVEEVPPRDISGWKWGLVVTAILSSIFLYALDNTVVADIQPVIVTDFHSVEKLTWLSAAFLLGATATNLVWGKIFGQFNAKWTYIFNVILFEVGSAICGAAPSMDVMIVGRALSGIGGSGLYIGVMTLIAATTTMPERPLYVGGTGLTW